ncbi:CoA-transferase family III domain-containing protein [Glomus cerebriforme]|uniref:CoA-transferase family III domain-containing protein n=1 Tax=Glomus cerebriforme TaxID=658196 RepID=A0A397TWS7_9GLOM|nr:CoA-transferase family III domain-containing protein [Glomus cerebriforme]
MSSTKRLLPLEGIKVIEIAGLAPAPFAGMVLADFGASVIRIDKSIHTFNMDVLSRNKRSISINLKSPIGTSILKRLICCNTDILIEPFRPGVMERLGLGPDVLCNINKKLIYVRLTGFGQKGKFSNMAGHDINYLAVSGVLSFLGRKNENPMFPLNILADFAGGGLISVLGILLALIERSKSGKGQVIDVAMVDGVKYLSTYPYLMKLTNQLWTKSRGENILDGGAHFYEVYKTKDNKFMAVGAIESQFYAELLKKLNLDASSLPFQLDNSKWNGMKQLFTNIFKTKTQEEWNQIFYKSDACVTPIYELSELSHKVPEPAPKLYKTPGKLININDKNYFLKPGKHSKEILKEHGYSESEIKEFSIKNVVNGLNYSKSFL